MIKKTLKTMLATTLAVVALSATVLGANNEISFNNIYRLHPECSSWVSEDSYKFSTAKKHTMTASFQKTYAKGTAGFAISSKVFGIYFPDAEYDLDITKAYSGINVTFTLDDTVKGTRYYWIDSGETADFKLYSLKDSY